MATQKPGLEPGRKLEATNVSFEISSPNPDHQTSSKFENVQSGAKEADAAENTAANQPEDSASVEETARSEHQRQEETQVEQPSEREQNRVQVLANQREQERQARLQAEARANQMEAMLRNLVNVQTAQPKESEEAVLARQYKSFNAQLGYPEDPREFADFNRNQAALAATKAAREESQRQASQDDMNRTLLANPELATDTFLQALVATKQAEAQRKGYTLPYSQATALAKQEMAQRFQKETTASVVKDDQAKDEAYVETTRGASTNRSSVQTPSAKDINNMTLAEMEQALKEAGEW